MATFALDMATLTSIQAREQEIIDEFSMIDDTLMQYEYLIDLGKMGPEFDSKYRTDDHLIKGCQSKVWLHAWAEDGLIYFTADSNASITKGLVALLVRVLSGLPSQDIVNAELGFIDAIHLRSHLSEQRSNGLNAMIKQMKYYALAFSA